MQGVFPLVCLCLVISVAVQESVGSTTNSPTLHQENGKKKGKQRLRSVVAQLVGNQTKMAAKLHAVETRLAATERELQITKTKLEATETELQSTTAELQASRAEVSSRVTSGSSFVRWGRKTCPTSTTLVYVGVAGGKSHEQRGSGTNPLCLTRTPQFDNTPKPTYFGYLYGAEYKHIHHHHDHDVPCSVCLAPQSSTIMVPATLTCPPGWTSQYTGHLVAQYKDHFATEYVCLDGSPEDDSSGAKNDNDFLFYYAMTVCGSLPCPPYINDKVVTCVVCSK